MSHILVAGERFPIDRAQLVLHHCDGPEADWNLELIRADRSPAGVRFAATTSCDWTTW